MSEQNNNKMTQIEQQLNSKFEAILKEIRTNRDSNLIDDDEDAEDNRPSTSNSENKLLRRKHASNTGIDKNKTQDYRFQSSEMYELRQPTTPFGVANETLNVLIIMNENRQEADYHNIHPCTLPKLIFLQLQSSPGTSCDIVAFFALVLAGFVLQNSLVSHRTLVT